MMQKFLLNLVLAAVFVALVGSVTVFDFVVGFLIGAGVVSMLSRAAGRGGYLGRLWGVLRFVGYFLFILVKANVQVALEVVTPGYTMRPRFLAYDVTGLNDVEATAVANAITLTPGTLSADLVDTPGDTPEAPPARRTLHIHAMYAEDRDAAVAELDGLRHRLLREVFNHDR